MEKWKMGCLWQESAAIRWLWFREEQSVCKHGEAVEGISCSWWNGDLAEAVSGDD